MLKDEKAVASKSAVTDKDSKEGEGKEAEKEKKEKEPDFEMLQNPTRVIKPQV